VAVALACVGGCGGGLYGFSSNNSNYLKAAKKLTWQK
jgi:hypothetical protein